jgi:hypothetical protein
MSYVADVLGDHATESRATVFAPSAFEPKIMVVMNSFIVSIHGLVFAVIVTVYLGCV